MDDLDDFIEEDEMSEDERQLGSEDEMAMAGRRREIDHHRQRGPIGGSQEFDVEKLEDMEDIFGIGDYEHLLVTEAEDMEKEEAPMELKDVFEHSHLAERMLTSEDDQIRMRDIPERFQISRKPYEHLEEYDPEDEARVDRTLAEEAEWISQLMLQHKPHFPRSLQKQFLEAVNKCLQFFIKENLEVPFVFQHRKDYLIHAYRPDGDADIVAEKLLSQDELWNILDYDLKFRAYLEKRKALYRTYEALFSRGITDDVYEQQSLHMSTPEDIQDLQDYLHFQHHSVLKDAQIASNGMQAGSIKRRPGGGKSFLERFRQGRGYGLVRALGITADQFAINVEIRQKREFAEDPEIYPDQMAEGYADGTEFTTGESALTAAKRMLAEEIFMSPRLRRNLRYLYFGRSVIHVDVTEKGIKRIDDQHQYYVRKLSLLLLAVRLTII